MSSYGHRLDCIKAYIRGYLSEETSQRMRTALTQIHDLAEGVDIADAATSSPD